MVDAIQTKLVKAIERKDMTSYRGYGATPSQSFPRVPPRVFGDGRALLALTTIHRSANLLRAANLA